MPDIPTAIICFSHTNTNPLSIAELILCLSTPQLDGTGNKQLLGGVSHQIHIHCIGPPAAMYC
jgi:hypothetical protein